MAQKKVTDIKEVDKTKSLDNALGQIERQFGSGTVILTNHHCVFSHPARAESTLRLR